jgi:cytochrome c peroxidase
MRKSVILVMLIAAGAIYFFYSCNTKGKPPERNIAQNLAFQVDSFAVLCNALKDTTAKEKQLQELFLNARIAYKKFEWAAEYFEPATARFVNGPPVPEVEKSGQVFEPSGLQVIEAYLFPHYDKSQKKEMIRQLGIINRACEKFKTHFEGIDIFPWQVFDAGKLEVFRVIALGITGFDDPITLHAMKESSASLKSLRAVFLQYPENNIISTQFDEAISFLDTATDFNTFNRMEFIIKYGNPLTRAITGIAEKLQIHFITYDRLLNQEAKTLFDSNAFNVNAYAPDHASFKTAEKIALGKMLFSDPSLSGNGKRSCQSCHQPDKAFTDGLVKNLILDKNDQLPRNTPTLLNAALQPALFYDSRVSTLEEQSVNVVQNENEMHGSMLLATDKLWKDKIYHDLFVAAYPDRTKNGIDTFQIMNAIGSYVRSLVSLNSRFDEYTQGNSKAMNEQEINGFNLFMGKAKCGTCHYMPLFNGNFPPRFVKTESEVIGVPSSRAGKEIDSDLGRFAIIQTPSLKHSFKIPTLRNAANTGPYMHSGIYNTLEEVMDFYNKGGGRGLGLVIDNQTLPFDKLNLSPDETSNVIAFIKSLSGK